MLFRSNQPPGTAIGFAPRSSGAAARNEGTIGSSPMVASSEDAAGTPCARAVTNRPGRAPRPLASDSAVTARASSRRLGRPGGIRAGFVPRAAMWTAYGGAPAPARGNRSPKGRSSYEPSHRAPPPRRRATTRRAEGGVVPATPPTRATTTGRGPAARVAYRGVNETATHGECRTAILPLPASGRAAMPCLPGPRATRRPPEEEPTWVSRAFR